MPVILPAGPAARGAQLNITALQMWHVLALLLIIGASTEVAATPVTAARVGILSILVKWTPLLLTGFCFNIAISLLSMLLGTVAGLPCGLGMISPRRPVRVVTLPAVEVLRNAPWLVLLFFMIYLLPFQMHLFGHEIPFPGWVKSIIALALPVMANVAEIVRGAIQSIHPGQWEAAESLGFSRHQQLWSVVLPQCVIRMIPPWMNLFAILTMSTTLASIVGVNEVVTLASDVQAAESGRTDLLLPLYSYVLLMFFVFSYPIAVYTRRLERSLHVRI